VSVTAAGQAEFIKQMCDCWALCIAHLRKKAYFCDFMFIYYFYGGHFF
jgi:hypothetical protein